MRIAFIVLGLVMMVAGAACGASGIASYRALDEGDYLLSGPATFTTSTVGFFSSTGELTGDPGAVRRGTVTIRVRVTSGENLFVGIAPREQVDAYAGAASREIMADVTYDPLDFRRTAVGTERSLPPPASALTWTAAVEGDAPLELTWQALPGEHTLAILHRDASPGLTATLEFGTKFRYLRFSAIAGIVLGTVLLLGGLAFLVSGLRQRRSPSPG
ncbi:hypothetical protein [Tepidiforma sp.]|uniref:hypothetical protein n=1 Tax=Tepidiforma sp. TaxID=2682230 RepID=UPI002ADD3368|nr:hypothetical protein [Tepidiforma sp.]